VSLHADRLPFPATPEDMCELLYLEDLAKSEGGLTHAGMDAYVLAKCGYVVIDIDRVEVAGYVVTGSEG
jgi:hypothetical protein